jgi:hypothetical protein
VGAGNPLALHRVVTVVDACKSDKGDTKGKFCLLLSRLQLLPRGIC